MSLKCVLESWAYRFYIAQLCKIEDAKIEKSHGIGIFFLLRTYCALLRLYCGNDKIRMEVFACRTLKQSL